LTRFIETWNIPSFFIVIQAMNDIMAGMRKLWLPMLIVVFFVTTPTVFAATKKTTAKSIEKLFYYVPGEGAYVTLDQYVKNIDIFAPQVYKVDRSGNLIGKISDKALGAVAKNTKTKIMPLVFQEGFSPDTMHTILSSTDVQDKIITALIAEAKAKGYWGWQFDFENMFSTDRNAYSLFVEKTAAQFHKNNLKLSVAIIARTSEKPEDLPEGSWDYWAGVFDYKRIGKAADFVTLMAYDEPGSKGPVASLPWVKKVLTYLEKSVPKSKISLGIPTYGWQWDMDTKKRVKSIGYDKITELEVNKKFTKKGYDATAQTAWITYSEGEGSAKKNYKIWYEDIRSFKTKYALAKSHGLRGVSVWVIGMEDEKIWNNLK
jgi:spore germination protein YaaH